MKSNLRQHGRYRGELLGAAVSLVVYGGCLLLFFALMSVNNWPLRHLSRTSGTTLLTWCAMGAVMLAVYGRMDLGGRTRRQLICGQALACLATDMVTYLQLQIMNVNPNNNDRLMLFGDDLPWLVLAMALQLALIAAAVCAGAAAYDRLHPPRRALLVAHRAEDLPRMRQLLQARARRLAVADCCLADDAALHEKIGAAEVAVLSGGIPAPEREALIELCYRQRREMLLCAGLAEVLIHSAHPVLLDDTPCLALNAGGMTLMQRIVKRGMDIVLSLTALLVLWPVMLGAALTIRLTDGGPVLFRQTRLTASSRPFVITKFRTMKAGSNPAESAVEGDGRITRTGAFLRRFHLDELPQLFNVLRGDMSLVGPRPEMMENVEKYKKTLPAFAYRERVKAGLTGFAQVEGRYSTSPESKLMLDLLYIQTFSVWTDVKLLLRTLTVFFRPDSTQGFAPDDRPGD